MECDWFIRGPVAQRIRASDYGSEGREFESLQARFKTAHKGSFFICPHKSKNIALRNKSMEVFLLSQSFQSEK